MKKLLAAVTMIGFLAGCNSQPDVNTFVANVQSATKEACKFLPTASTVLAIFTANSTLPVTAVATAICQAVNGVSMTPGAGRNLGVETKPVVKVGDTEIKVEGTFIK